MAFCLVPQPRLVCAEYFASPLVVEATLVRIRVLGHKADPESIIAHVYTLSVDRVLRGKIAGDVRVYEGNDSGRATFDWTQGTVYLLFLSYVPAEKAWSLDGCGNSGPLDKAEAALSQISTIKSSHGAGVIHGVTSQEALSTPIPGVRVVAMGIAGHFATTSDRNGRFQIKVPAGEYRVRALKNGFSFSKADISYGDPRKIQIEPGGCAQVQFAGAEAPQ